MKLLFDDLSLFPGEPEESLRRLLSEKFGLAGEFTYEIVRKSLDARDKSGIVYRYRIEADVPEEAARALLTRKGVSPAPAKRETATPRSALRGVRVIVIGTGPAGLFCAQRLVESGAEVEIFERGRRIEERIRDIHILKHEGILNAESNVLFGEGGAGTYSDGKLTTRIHKPEVDWFYRRMVDLGAPPSILYEQKPHLGTDRLVPIITAIRRRLEEHGAVIHFNSRVVDLITDGGSVYGVRTLSGEEYRADAVVLAGGHSARDVYPMLEIRGARLEKKGFAMGVRVEHPAALIDRIRYGKPANELGLPAAEYFMSFQNRETGRGVYSFCMCPGGEVINSSSEEGRLCVNGMSYSGREGRFSNAALAVTVGSDDVPGDALAGLRLQREIEEKAFAAGGGGFRAPAQRVTSFVSGKQDGSLRETSYMPGVRAACVSSYLPEWIASEVALALKSFDRRMRGYLSDEGLIIGAETRTSSPVRILRGGDFQSVSLKRLFPAGEGAGYAGGIVSSAVDGIRTADMICRLFEEGVLGRGQ